MRITIRTDSVEIEGYVNAVGRDSRKLTDEDGYPFKEQIKPGTFANAIRAKKDQNKEIKMLLNHDPMRVLGGTDTNLELEEDSIGLHARAIVTDPEVIQKARERKLSGWSFGFRELDSESEYTNTGHRVIVTDMDLVEVTLVDDTAIPAYAGTSVHTRTDGSSEKVLTRTMDGEAVFSVEDQETATRTQDPKPQAPDYSKYTDIIKNLRR